MLRKYAPLLGVLLATPSLVGAKGGCSRELVPIGGFEDAGLPGDGDLGDDDLPQDPGADCAAVSCLEGTVCRVVDGEAQCIDLPDVGPADCAAVTCIEGTDCQIIDGEAHCVPVDGFPPDAGLADCAAVTCLEGTVCTPIPGGVACLPM